MAKYNLNLAANYVPDWAAWEVAREIICNAIDADPGMILKHTGSDILEVWTETVPTVAQMFVVGEGSKRPDGDSIGQFGEGFKMAALAATRMAQGSQYEGMTLRTPESTIRFKFVDVLDTQTLHAVVTKEANTPGFTATIHLPNIKKAVRGKIKQNLPAGPFGSAKPEGARIFVKGVYIATIKGDALYDWNLNDLQTNRDRAMVSEWDARWAMGAWLAENIEPHHATQMMAKSSSKESKAMEHQGSGQRVRETLQKAFVDQHGSNAVLQTGTEADIVAARKGHQLVMIEHPEMRKAVEHAGIRTASAVAGTMFDFETVDMAQYLPKVSALKSLDSVIKAPNVGVRIFAVREDALLGYADIGDRILWLSEQLFRDGSEQELVATYLHEMAHHMSGATDASLSFERSLDMIAGCLGVRLLWGQVTS